MSLPPPIINLYHVDNLEFMKTCETNKYDLAICDPPYDKKVNMSGGGRYARYENHFVPLNVAPPEEFFTELFRISKNQVIFGGNYFSLPPTRGFIVWDKKQPEDFTFSMAEYAWTSFDRNSLMFRGVSRTSGPDKRFHPTQKPIALYQWILKHYAKEGDKIFDPHGGSFSCAIACLLDGFDCDTCELDDMYFSKAKERFEKYKQEKESQLTFDL